MTRASIVGLPGQRQVDLTKPIGDTASDKATCKKCPVVNLKPDNDHVGDARIELALRAPKARVLPLYQSPN